MKSIQKTTYNRLVINKSVFHNYLIPVASVDAVEKHLRTIKDEHPGANHYCTAYIIKPLQSIQKYDDNGEPSGTAGLPMLDVLKKNDLTNVFAISVRFFGGIKLGASGLVRAYAKGVSQNIESATFTYLTELHKVRLRIPFDEIGHVEHFIRKDYHLVDTTYDTHVTYHIIMKADQFDSFKQFFINNTKGKAEITITETTHKFL
ncbi:MAG: YigZ family protein [Candidatus Izemoplasma sp.]|nr:YigZ family protein [Candidatus Izemoplasma sp.]